MKIFPILSATLACGLIASSCAVKNMSLNRPVSSVPSNISSAIPAASSEPAVSSIAAISSAISSVADKTPSVAVSGKAASATGGGGVATNGPSMRWQPTMIRYQHRLYKIDEDFPAQNDYRPQETSATPGGKIAAFSLTDEIIINVCTVRGENSQKNLCINDGWEGKPNTYCKFSYLCGDEISIPGRTYRIAGGISQFLDCPSSDSAESSTADGYTMAFNYYCYTPSALKNIRASLDTKLGTTAFGAAVYQITDIDPADAVYMNLGDDWFLIRRKGYDGVSIQAFSGLYTN